MKLSKRMIQTIKIGLPSVSNPSIILEAEINRVVLGPRCDCHPHQEWYFCNTGEDWINIHRSKLRDLDPVEEKLVSLGETWTIYL